MGIEENASVVATRGCFYLLCAERLGAYPGVLTVIDLSHHIILNSGNAEALKGSIGNSDALTSVDGGSACQAGPGNTGPTGRMAILWAGFANGDATNDASGEISLSFRPVEDSGKK